MFRVPVITESNHLVLHISRCRVTWFRSPCGLQMCTTCSKIVETFIKFSYKHCTNLNYFYPTYPPSYLCIVHINVDNYCMYWYVGRLIFYYDYCIMIISSVHIILRCLHILFNMSVYVRCLTPFLCRFLCKLTYFCQTRS